MLAGRQITSLPNLSSLVSKLKSSKFAHKGTGNRLALSKRSVRSESLQKNFSASCLPVESTLRFIVSKDLPTTPVEGLTLAATPERAPIGDALISSVADRVADLPEGARVGTGSFRRKAQLLNRRPDLVVEDLRGNVETRLRKLDDGEHDAILLAHAGLARLGYEDRIAQVIPPSEILPAPGQGALGIECRTDDAKTLSALAALNHAPTRAAVTAERSALARLEGGCLAALGAWARVEEDQLRLEVVVLSEDGAQRLDQSGVGQMDNAEQLGISVADQLLAQGAAELLVRRQG